MILLAIDTAASLCAACVLDSGAGERGRAVRDLGKGHAEHLMAVVAEALDKAGAAYGDLDAIAVSVGPGSFTGVRVGVAAARGLALALNVPAVGISTLEAIAAEALPEAAGIPITVALDAGRGQLYLQHFDAGAAAVSGPEAVAVDAAAARISEAGGGRLLAGSGVPLLAQSATGIRMTMTGAATTDIATYARIAARRLAKAAPGSLDKPRPLYLRDADARPQDGFALPREKSP
jgi:tRNA threonylcarbamoyl adenosine modification protein YeaZ